MNPVESVIEKRENGFVIAEAARLWIEPDDLVMDVTYGRGLWWTKYKPIRFIAHDLQLDGVDFRHLPEESSSIDVVAFDPPYISIGSLTTSTIPDFHARYGLGGIKGFEALMEMNMSGLTECARVLRIGGRILAKSQDYVEGGRYCPGHFRLIQKALTLGLEIVDEFVHVRGPGPQPKNRRQVHSRRVHSFLSIFSRVR